MDCANINSDLMQLSQAITHVGVVTRISPFHMIELDERGTGQRFVFRLDKLRGYRGEPLKKIGLKAGRPVRFAIDGERVTAVELA